MLVVLLIACSSPREPDTSASKATAPPPPAKAADTKPVVASGEMGRVVAGPLPIDQMLGHAPAEVQARLGEPLGKGMSRKSCVRYVPARTRFRCSFALQRYADPGGHYKAVGVEYEDGKATALAFEGMLGATGPYDPVKALAYVGLELPGAPKLDTPSPGTQVHSWFNEAARLLIDDRQYRVQVSTVEDDWARTKVEIILNHPLTDDERARIVPDGGEEPAPQ